MSTHTEGMPRGMLVVSCWILLALEGRLGFRGEPIGVQSFFGGHRPRKKRPSGVTSAIQREGERRRDHAPHPGHPPSETNVPQRPY